MTFSDESLIKLEEVARQQGFKLDGYELDNKIATIAIRRFTENWRVQKKKSLRHWCVTEIGGTRSERLHIHGIVWTEEDRSEIEKFWKFGHTWIGVKMVGVLLTLLYLI